MLLEQYARNARNIQYSNNVFEKRTREYACRLLSWHPIEIGMAPIDQNWAFLLGTLQAYYNPFQMLAHAVWDEAIVPVPCTIYTGHGNL